MNINTVYVCVLRYIIEKKINSAKSMFDYAFFFKLFTVLYYEYIDCEIVIGVYAAASFKYVYFFYRSKNL